MQRSTAVVLLLLGVAACATPGQVRRIETQLAVQQREQERRDSATTAMLRDIMLTQQRTIDSLESTRRAIALAKGESSAEVIELQRSILALQENLNQSNRRLNEFYAQLDARQAALDQVDGDTTTGGGVRAASALQMLEAGQAQLNRGAMATARMAFQDLLNTYPTSTLVPDALYGLAESYLDSHPDSATAYLREVARDYRQSPRAASAMFKLGDRAQRAGDLQTAKGWFQQVVTAQYRGLTEYALAEERLRQIP